jgi:predicted NAD/FAD-dependent oxidoreductase
MKVVVVGSGLSGLMASRLLVESGHSVVVFDKGRGMGGRLATRRIGEGVFDHGAQFFTVREDDFDHYVQEWIAAGAVREWCRGFGPDQDGFPRYVGNAGMTSIAKYLALRLKNLAVDIHQSALVFSVLPEGDGWKTTLDDGTSFLSDAVLLTCPIAQSFGFAFTAGIEIPEDLRSIDYDRTLGLLAVLDRPPVIPAPGAVQNPDDIFSFVGDNMAKGISPVPAVTFHANPEWSLAHWDTPHDEAEALLTELARPYLGDAAILASNYKRWRFATPQRTWPDRHWMNDAGNFAIAGDAFSGPRIEGAALSGLSAARALISR